MSLLQDVVEDMLSNSELTLEDEETVRRAVDNFFNNLRIEGEQ